MLKTPYERGVRRGAWIILEFNQAPYYRLARVSRMERYRTNTPTPTNGRITHVCRPLDWGRTPPWLPLGRLNGFVEMYTLEQLTLPKTGLKDLTPQTWNTLEEAKKAILAHPGVQRT